MSAFGIEVDEVCVCVFDKSPSKDELLNRLTDAIGHSGPVTSMAALREAVIEREAVASTAIGDGVAIPHVRIDTVIEPVIGVAICPPGVEFDAPDGNPVRIVVLFAMPPGSNRRYLSLVAQLMVALKAQDFRDRLLACTSPKEVAAVLNEP